MFNRPEIFNHPLKNRWYALRHGQSRANKAGLIVSDPQNGTQHYGLTETGKEQVTASTSKHSLPGDTRIVSSDFSRTRETATIAASTIGTKHNVAYSLLLRERFFGKWELTESSNYDKVWRDDVTHPEHTNSGVESITSVASRAARLVEVLEQACSNQTIVLASHGDTLQILECVFLNQPLSSHRSLCSLEVAELRLLSGVT